MTARVHGLDQLKRRAAAVVAAVEATSADTQREALAEIEREWRDGVPVESGTLRDSITHDNDSVYTSIRYAPFVRSRAGQRAVEKVGRSFRERGTRMLRAAVLAAARRQ